LGGKNRARSVEKRRPDPEGIEKKRSSEYLEKPYKLEGGDGMRCGNRIKRLTQNAAQRVLGEERGGVNPFAQKKKGREEKPKLVEITWGFNTSDEKDQEAEAERTLFERKLALYFITEEKRPGGG